MLNEKKKQMQKATYCVIPFVWNIQNREIYRKQIGVYPGMGGMKNGDASKGCWVSFRIFDRNILELDGGNSCITLWVYQNPLDCILEKGEFYNVWIIAHKAVIYKVENIYADIQIKGISKM